MQTADGLFYLHRHSPRSLTVERLCFTISCSIACYAASLLWRHRDVTFLVLGLDNAGKSTVCACLQNGQPLSPGRSASHTAHSLQLSDTFLCVHLLTLSPSSASTEDITPTIGFANGHVRLKGCNVTLLDLGGGERLREIWHNYYAEVRGQ